MAEEPQIVHLTKIENYAMMAAFNAAARAMQEREEIAKTILETYDVHPESKIDYNAEKAILTVLPPPKISELPAPPPDAPNPFADA